MQLAPLPHSNEVVGFEARLGQGLSVRTLHVLLVPAQVFSRYNGFLP